MKSWYEQALATGRRLAREEARRSRMAHVLMPRFERLAAKLTLAELELLDDVLCAEFPHLARERRRRLEQDAAAPG